VDYHCKAFAKGLRSLKFDKGKTII